MGLTRWRLLRRKLLALLTIGSLAAAVVALAPAAVGGQMTYLIVTGNSMEPTYHSGDLVLVRDSDSLRTGDISVYRHPQIGPVIHRIIARDGQDYVFQGDNNGFVDGYHPSRGEIIGEAWFAIPRLGSALKAIRKPVVLTFLTVVSVAGIAGGATRPARQRGRTRPAHRRAFPNRGGSI